MDSYRFNYLHNDSELLLAQTSVCIMSAASARKAAAPSQSLPPHLRSAVNPLNACGVSVLRELLCLPLCYLYDYITVSGGA